MNRVMSFYRQNKDAVPGNIWISCMLSFRRVFQIQRKNGLCLQGNYFQRMSLPRLMARFPTLISIVCEQYSVCVFRFCFIKRKNPLDKMREMVYKYYRLLWYQRSCSLIPFVDKNYCKGEIQ